MVKRIRGVAFSTRVSPQMTNRMVDGARGVLNSPGFGLTLVAETTTGMLLSAEASVAMTNHVRGALASGHERVPAGFVAPACCISAWQSGSHGEAQMQSTRVHWLLWACQIHVAVTVD